MQSTISPKGLWDMRLTRFEYKDQILRFSRGSFWHISSGFVGEEEFEDIAATVNRLAEISLLGANADSSTNNNESHLAYQSEVQWRVVM